MRGAGSRVHEFLKRRRSSESYIPKVGELLRSPPLPHIKEHDPVASALIMIAFMKLDHLLVTSILKEPLGIVTSRDVFPLLLQPKDFREALMGTPACNVMRQTKTATADMSLSSVVSDIIEKGAVVVVERGQRLAGLLESQAVLIWLRDRGLLDNLHEDCLASLPLRLRTVPWECSVRDLITLFSVTGEEAVRVRGAGIVTERSLNFFIARNLPQIIENPKLLDLPAPSMDGFVYDLPLIDGSLSVDEVIMLFAARGVDAIETPQGVLLRHMTLKRLLSTLMW